MPRPQSGDTVTIHYTGRLEDGRVFANSGERGPLELKVGAGGMIPGVEDTLTRMQPGEKRTVTIPAEHAYGPHHPELVLVVDREELPEHIEPEVGQALRVRQDDEVVVVTITDVSDEQVTIDANHPLAGQNLTFDLQLVEIRGQGRRRRG